MPFLYEELSGKILETCFEVSNELGNGFLESVYHRATLIALHQKGLDAQSQVSLAVYFRSEVVGEFVADILVEDKIILELKAIFALASEHQAQVINYLKATGIEVGLLVNFGRPRLEWKRLRNPNNRE
ncbi:MAG: GxxExxY protein [Chloroflexi bacterium]|nr:GxxExxY protein [Chloroflexota bacterium]